MIIERDLYKKIKPVLNSPEVIIVTGMRRTGKTTLFKYIYENIVSNNKIYLDLENPLNQKIFEENDFEKIKLNLEIKGLNFTKQAYIFLDEIQYLKNLPQIVKYLYDHYKIKFFLTGSSSFYLKNLFTESLSGRKYIFELFPLNFKEFLLFKGENLIVPKPSEHVSSTVFEIMERYYQEYLEFGGFPGVVLKESFEEKKMALEDIFSSYFQLEVVQFGDYRKAKSIRDLILLLMQRIGSKIDIDKLSKELGITRPTVYEYLAFLEGTYFISLVKPYSKSQDIQIRGQSKIYFCDSGLIKNMVVMESGALFENNIFQLLRTQGKLNYFQKKNGVEIDFILDKKEAFEVKIKPSLSDLEKFKRMVKELNIPKFRMVSKNYTDLQNTGYGFNLI